jgi:phosphate:Na+ symporter
MEIFVGIFAGLGLFFVGVKLVGGNLKQLSGRWFRRLIEAATRNLAAAGLVGCLSGALTQSSSAITFISMSMVTAGVAGVDAVAPMVIWANVGTSVLVLLSAVDIKLPVFFLLGVTGFAYYFNIEKAPRLRHLSGALLGLGLLFLGLELIKSGAEPLKTMAAVREFLAFAASSVVLAFLVGAVLAIVAQSSAMVSIIAVAMTNIGILPLDQTMVIVVGASFGSGVATVLLSSGFSGVGRQIAYLQAAVKLLGVIFVLPIVTAEAFGAAPWIKALVAGVAPSAASQVAVVYLILQLVGAALAMLFRRPLLALVAELSPPTLEETLSKPRFIYAAAIADPRTALDLVGREQARLLEQAVAILDVARQDGGPRIARDVLFAAGTSVARECDAFLTEILDQNNARDVLLDVIDMQKRNEILVALIGAANDYVLAAAAGAPRPAGTKMARLLFALGESLHTILTLAADAAASRDADDIALLLQFTSDRSAQMEGIRRQVMAVETVTPADHDVLYATTTLFERSLWLIRRYATLLERSVARPAEPAAARDGSDADAAGAPQRDEPDRSASCSDRRIAAMASPSQIKLAGRLDTSRVGEIETGFYANVGAIPDGGETVVIDLGEVDFISSLGIRMLVTAGKLLARRRHKVAIVAPRSEPVREALQVAGLADIFAFFDSEAAARAAG